MPEASLTLPLDPSSVPRARHFVVQTLKTWGQDEASWAAAQIVSELASNCSLHARTEFVIRLAQDEGGLRLEVHDSSPGRVQPRRYSSSSTTGRGLRLVDALAETWGVDMDSGGKTVWVALRTQADVTPAADVEEEPDLDRLLAAFDDDEADSSTRAAACHWLVAA